MELNFAQLQTIYSLVKSYASYIKIEKVNGSLLEIQITVKYSQSGNRNPYHF